ncbi:MAG TPA: dTDP-4-dehydrorhamnose reductase [Thermoanaerobaculia bacterium]|nr:dTDP-4-dehydrorhamnose reductase [Thermoanaerobaculia bacterium]
MTLRALVFGGTGMLGRAVVASARRRGLAALALSRAHGDVTDRDRVLYWAEEFRPTLIVNCAAYTKVDDCETESEQAMAVNGLAVDHLVEAARRIDARLLQVSTDYVFAGDAERPYREDDATAPATVYGRTKLAGEERALAYEKSLVVRTSWLFGPGGPNFVATMLRLIRQGKTPLRVVDDQTGCPTYTSFLAEALWRLAEAEASGVVHYRNRGPVTWCGFAREIAQLWDASTEVVPVTTDEFPRPAPRPAYSVLDVERYESLTGRRVEPWGLGVIEYLANYRETHRGRP